MKLRSQCLVLRSEFAVTDHEIMLLEASSSEFEAVEIHNTVIENDVAKMVPQPQLPIPAHQSISLEPGGLHLMLMDRKQPLVAGDQVNLTLKFSEGSPQQVMAEVKKVTE